MAEDSTKLIRREVVASYRDRRVIREVWETRHPDYPLVVLESVPNQHIVGRLCDVNTATD